MEGVLLNLVVNAARDSDSKSWLNLPETLFPEIHAPQSTLAKYGLVAAGVTAVGVSAVVASKKLSKKENPQSVHAPLSMKLVLPQTPPVPVLSENVKLGDAKIHYELFGKGPQKILLIGGFAATLEFMEDIISELSTNPEYQICAYDQRNSGKSTAPVTKLSSKLLASDALALLDHLGWEKVHVFGISMGGCVATELALSAPQKVASLFLSATTAGNRFMRMPLGPRFYGFAFGRFLKMEKSKLVELLLKQQHSEKFLKTLANEEHNDAVFSSQTNGDLLKAYLLNNFDRLVSFNLETLSSQASVVSTHYVSDQQLRSLALTNIPITVHRNTADVMDPQGAGSIRLEKALSSSPNFTSLVFHGAGHWGLREDFPAFIAALKSNISKAGSGSCFQPSS